MSTLEIVFACVTVIQTSLIVWLDRRLRKAEKREHVLLMLKPPEAPDDLARSIDLGERLGILDTLPGWPITIPHESSIFTPSRRLRQNLDKIEEDPPRDESHGEKR